MSKRDDLHRWLFARKGGKEIKFRTKKMPFKVFEPDAVWGGSCELGDTPCRIRVKHNMSGEKGKRLEVWFPHSELDEEVPWERSTLVGYMQVVGNFRQGTGRCIFEPVAIEEK